MNDSPLGDVDCQKNTRINSRIPKVSALDKRLRHIISNSNTHAIVDLTQQVNNPMNTAIRSTFTTSPGQNNWGIGRKTQNEFFRGLLAPWGFGEHPKTHTFLESTCPEVNETAIKISNFGRYPQFRRPSNLGPPSGAILTPTCARAWEARAGCVSMPPGGLWRG